MATNRDAPSGFIARKPAQGGALQFNEYFIASALASNICRGDGVIPVNTNKRINVAAATNRLIGVFDGVFYIDANGDVQIRPRWATGTVLKTGSVARASVYDDPRILFEIQSDGVGAEADVGALADIVVAAGSALTGQSAMELQESSVGSGDTLRIEEFVDRPDNVRGSANAKFLVQITKHYKAGALTAI